MKAAINYLYENKDRFLNELFGLIRIPSISSHPDKKNEMIKAAEYWRDSILTAGADKAILMPTTGNPVVYGEKIISNDLPTILVYAHYDVMPVDPIELWNSNPFEPVVKEDKIFARGANDDKGQGFMHAKAFEAMVKTGTLPCNVKFMIEGEEEVGSPSLAQWCAENRKMLAADIILISDTSMIDPATPSITVGVRGLTYMQIEVTGPDKDLHSGIFGGAVANPANVLANLIGSLIDEKGHITIPGFYDDVVTYSVEEREDMARRPFDLKAYLQSLNIEEVQGEEGYTTLERTGIRPTLDVNGMWSGYTDEGTKTVLPSKAFAKISMRLVPNQKWEKIAELFEKHIVSIAPKSVKVKVIKLHGGESYGTPVTIPAYIAASKACEDVFGKKPIPVRSGGSIPIISAFEEILGIKSLLLGFGLESDAIHSPNENYRLENFYNGIETIIRFYEHYSKVK
ncbi:MAG: dipeptidase [Bacteroidetes bacterium]|nr:dipeptidase [Bacteroidota bacterium]